MKFICIACGHKATLKWGTKVTFGTPNKVSNTAAGYVMLCGRCGVAQVIDGQQRLADAADIQAIPPLWREQLLKRQMEITDRNIAERDAKNGRIPIKV